MIKKNLILILPILISGSGFAQDFFSSINKGKTFEVNVLPIGDAYTDLNDEFTIKLKRQDSSFILELRKNELLQKKELSKTLTLELVNFFKNWKTDRCRWTECGSSYGVTLLFWICNPAP